MNRTKFILVASLILLTIITASPKAFAAPGDIDPTFRTGGVVTSAFGGSAYAAALQPDGKLVLAGRGEENAFTLLRYNANGTLDVTFGTNGKVVTDVPGDNEIPFAIAVQPDGKILVAGQFQIGNDFDYDFGVIRYNPDGSLDTSFGTGGRVSTAVGDREDVARSIVIQPDGKILVGGSAFFFGGTSAGRFAVVRYNPNGTLDSTFDTDGKAVIQQSGFGDMARQADGKIVVASSEGFGSASNFVVSRLNLNGSLDSSFGGGSGMVTTNFNSGASAASSVLIQPDGKIVAAGTGFGGAGQGDDFALARYNADGSLDTSFDGDGKVTTSFGSREDTINSIVLQPDGKIVAGGYSIIDGTSNQMAFARYNPDGTLDSGFGTTGGKFTVRLFPGRDYVYDIVLQTDGKIIAAGTVGGSPARFAAIRFTPAGIPDQSFNPGTPGRAVASLGEINAANAVVIQPDGRILTAGATSTASLLDFSLARFHADGTPDITFGIGGKTSTSVSSSIDGAEAVALQTDGKIVAVGYSGFPGVTDITVVRYNANGSLDNTFSGDGIAVLQRSGSLESATGVVVQTDGKIVIGGYSNTSSSFMYFLLARFNPDGTLDNSFGASGIVSTDIGNGDDFAKALLLQPDGKLIAAGTARTGSSNGDFAAVRYNANGSLDATFGTGGKVVMPIDGNDDGNDDATAAALQTDGKIIVAGNTAAADAPLNNFALTRYNSNGTLDASFGNAGIISTSFGDSYLEAVTVQPNGRIVAVGEKINGSAQDIAVARFNPNGFLDTTFGDGGVVITDIDSRDTARSVAVQGGDKIIVAGSARSASTNPPQANLIVLRYFANTQTGFDFDGDGRADLSVYRPADGTWYLNLSSQGFTAVQFGVSTDKLAPADYDGDGRADIAVFRAGVWYLQRSQAGFTAVQFGAAGDFPQPADYDGDGRAELAVFRPSDGSWYVLNLVTNQFSGVQFGANGDKPVAADYDGDGKTDFAVYRPADGTWYLLRSRQGFTAVQFGISTDKAVAGDYDGDGKADPAVYRDGVWYQLRSNQGFKAVQFGISSDLPAPADYDGDGTTDLAVYRDNTWYLLQSTAGFAGAQFGAAGDKPVPNAFVQ